MRGIGRSSGLLATMALLGACAGVPAKRSESYNARKAMARELVHRADWEGAFGLVRGLFGEDPKDVEVLAMRGVIYREQKLLNEAEADLAQALLLKPGYAYAHSGLAVVYDRSGRSREALEHHRRAAELEPANAGYLNNLAFSLLAQGRTREAIPVFNQALRLDPTNPRIRNNLGFAYARSGDFLRAADHFTVGGSPAEAKNNLGFAYQSAGNLPRAFDLYVEALRLDPGLTRARQNLREVAKQLERPVPPELASEPRS